jgi:hypothetical protein
MVLNESVVLSPLSTVIRSAPKGGMQRGGGLRLAQCGVESSMPLLRPADPNCGVEVS